MLAAIKRVQAERSNEALAALLSLVEVVLYSIYRDYGAGLGSREKALADIRTAIGEVAILYPSERLTYRVTPWLYRYAVGALRGLLDQTWQRKRGGEVEESALLEEPNEEIDTPAVNPYALLDQALADGRIRPDDHRNFILHSEGKSDAEIAQILGSTASSVCRRRHEMRPQITNPGAKPLRNYKPRGR